MRLLFDNLGWKLFSLVLAVALWAGLVGETEVAASVPASVQFRNLPDDLEVSSDGPERLYLKVRGPGTRLTASELSQAAVVLDLKSVNKPGEQTFNLDRSTVDLPLGVTLSRVVPSQLRVRFERTATKQIPVEVRFAGPPPRGYRVAYSDPHPARLSIAGPQSKVDLVQGAQTDPIDLSSTVGSAEFRVPVYLHDPHVRFTGASTVAVRVSLEKIPERETK